MKKFVLLLLLSLSSSAWSEVPAVKDPHADSSEVPLLSDLRAELLSMQVEDQNARKQFFLTLRTPALLEAARATDAKNTARLKVIVQTYGWPTPDKVGRDGSDAAWLLVQHADADRAFQKQVLKIMEPLVDQGKIKGSNFAYLWDRVNTPQRYGTQGTCKSTTQWQPRAIEFPEQVDERRKQMGLDSLAAYSEMVKPLCANWVPKPEKP